MTVYVRWYGNVVQGELLDGEYLGMKQVRIPLDGHHPIALFMSGHVYDTVEKMQEVAKEVYSYPKEFPKPEDIIHPDLPCSYPADDYLNLEIFKRDNWDQEHNHLRIDKLDEFYRLWRATIAPSFKPLFVEGDVNRLAEEFKNYDGVIYNPDTPVILLSHEKEPKSTEGVPQNETPKQLQQSHKTVTQLSLFD